LIEKEAGSFHAKFMRAQKIGKNEVKKRLKIFNKTGSSSKF
jgi:hypothetical protein